MNELRVGLRTYREAETIGAEVFIADTLQNGAGYASFLGQPDEFQRLLTYMIDNGENGYQMASAARDCDSACYDCLKDYSNMIYHGLLDWRLAMDMARYALNGVAPDLSGYWSGMTSKLMRDFCAAFDWDYVDDAPLPCAERPDWGEAIIPIHPLWNDTGAYQVAPLAEAIALAERKGLNYRLASLFDLARRPAQVDAGV